jgi:hypothetical protein
MERDANRRFPTASGLAEELRHFIRREPILSRPISRVERLSRWAKRKPALAAATALTIFLAVAGPITAILMSGLYQRTRQLVRENDGLISRMESSIRDLTAQENELRTQLDVWEGKANPWAYWLWPPKRDAPPRRMLVADVLGHANAVLAQNLRDEQFDRETTARGYLGLAFLAEAAEEREMALDYYQQARDTLMELRRQRPNQPQIADAAADCSMRLARLARDSDKASSDSDLQNARALYHGLADEHETDPRYKIESLEAELASALVADPNVRDAQLSRVRDIYATLSADWPSQPDALYRLACFLTNQEPTLPPAANPLDGAMRSAAPPDAME